MLDRVRSWGKISAMLSPELELADLDDRHWRNGWRLLVPPRVLAWPAWALVICDRAPERVVSVIVQGRGKLDSPPKLVDVASYAKTLGVAAVIAIDRALIGELSAEIESVLKLDQDGVAQALVALRALIKRANKGVWTDPPLLELLPALGDGPLQRTFDLLVPDGSTLVAYVIEDDRSRVHTSIIALKDAGDIVLASQHRAIADVVSEPALARDWPHAYKRVLAAVEERFAKPSIGLFLERATLLKVLTGPSDTLAREMNAKRIAIDPAPAWLLGLLGGAAVAAVAGRAASALAAMLPQQARERAASLAHRAQQAVNPFGLLGFDPLELWVQFKRYYRA
jgi:hypothetical protein